jgi:hypothetical protein
LIPRRREMADSSHPSDDDPPPVYTADAAQNCLDLGPWMQVQFLDHLNSMIADEFFEAISNMTCFIGGEGYWWEDLNDERYLMERRQCIAFNLRRWEAIEQSDKDYLSALSDSFEDARQLWRNKTINMSAELKDRYRLVTVLGSDRRKARAMVVAIKRRIEDMEKDPERPLANNFTDVLNLNRADLVNTYGAVWLSKQGRNRDVMGPAKFVIARTTVSPKASQSDPRIFLEDISPGSIVVPRHVITFLKLEYGMSEMFLEARSPSWIAWLDAQRRANSAPHDAMLVDSFEPNADDGIFAPHVLAAPLLPTAVQRHDQVYGQPRAGGSGSEGSVPSKRSRVAGPADMSGSAETEDLMAVDVEIAGSSSLDSMDDPDVLNEGIKEEDIKEEEVDDKMEIEIVGDEHPSQVQEGGHPFC